MRRVAESHSVFLIVLARRRHDRCPFAQGLRHVPRAALSTKLHDLSVRRKRVGCWWLGEAPGRRPEDPSAEAAPVALGHCVDADSLVWEELALHVEAGAVLYSDAVTRARI
jgi:hypothetical protein